MQRFPIRAEVEAANNQRLDKLADPTHVYQAEDRPGVDVRGNPISRQTMLQLLDRLVVPREISLKVCTFLCTVTVSSGIFGLDWGASHACKGELTVRFIYRQLIKSSQNLEQGLLVNGSLGRIVDFRTTYSAIQMGTQIAFDDADGKKRISKKLGLGQHGSVLGTKLNNDNVHGTPIADDNRLYGQERVWPVVKFTNGREVVCVPTEFSVVSATGIIEAVREQARSFTSIVWL